MLRTLLFPTSRSCQPLLFEALSVQLGSGLICQASSQTLATLRRFSTEDSSSSAASQSPPAAAASGSSPKGVQQWRQWVDAKIGEKLEAKEEKPAAVEQEAFPRAGVAYGSEAAAAEPSIGSTVLQQTEEPLSGDAADVGDDDDALRSLLRPERTKSRHTPQEEIYDIIIPRRPAGPQKIGTEANYSKLAQATEAPRLFRGATNKAEEASPSRIHPYRMFYPGQLYAPQDLDPYSAKVPMFETNASRNRQNFISRGEVEACADFRNARFLSSFVSDAGKLVPRRRTRLQQKLHRHMCRQVKIARTMALMPIDHRLPNFQPRRRTPPKNPSTPAQAPPRKAGFMASRGN